MSDRVQDERSILCEQIEQLKHQAKNVPTPISKTAAE